MRALQPIVVAACETVRNYVSDRFEADSAAEPGLRPQYRALLAVCGDEDFLLDRRHYAPMTRRREEQSALDKYIGCGLWEEGDIFALFDLMNPSAERDGQKRIRHRDGAVLVDRYGKVLRAGVRVMYPDFGDVETPEVDEEIMRIKGGDEVGMRHSAAVRMSMYEPVDVAIAVSETAGSVTPLVDGRVLDRYVWIPGSRPVAAACPADIPIADDCSPGYGMTGSMLGGPLSMQLPAHVEDRRIMTRRILTEEDEPQPGVPSGVFA